jgi:hypothetical protein
VKQKEISNTMVNKMKYTTPLTTHQLKIAAFWFAFLCVVGFIPSQDILVGIISASVGFIGSIGSVPLIERFL